MYRRPPGVTRTDTLFPCATLCRSCGAPRWVTVAILSTLIRRKNTEAFWPMVTTSTSTPCCCQLRISPSSLRNRLLFRPPARPRSDETMTQTTRLICLVRTSDVEGTRVAVRVDHGGSRNIKKKNKDDIRQILVVQ